MGALKAFVKPIWKKFLQTIGAEAAEQGGMSAANKEVVKWMGAEGGEQYLKQQAAQQGMKEWAEESAKSGAKGGSGAGRTIVSVVIGVGIALAFPGVGLAGQLLIGAIVETGGEAAVGAVLNTAPDQQNEQQVEGAGVTGMVPADGGSTVQQDNEQSAGSDDHVYVNPGHTSTNEGTSTTTNTTTTTTTTTSTGHDPHDEGSHEEPDYDEPDDESDHE